ncbi:MAG: hypothetical protein J7513_13355 [Solirubrobacteraceae bacterium]|nr:hypothetical protein [Solirubrobacteraceae bacterium]
MDDRAHQNDAEGGDGGDDHGGGLSLRSIVFLVGALLVALAGGMVVWGASGDVAPTVADEASGCTVRALRFTVTDDPAEFARQQRFEVTTNTLPAPGFYDRELAADPTLHAASHSFVVVYARPDVGGDAIDGLKGLDAAARKTKAPVVISRRAQGPALVALSRGYQLSCRQGGAPQAAEVRRFAAQEYASVGDPDDRSTTPPAPTSPNDAPSPAEPTTPAG